MTYPATLAFGIWTRRVYGNTHIHRFEMGSKNIPISYEAYERLATLKRQKESFTDLINRLAGKRSILELAGSLTEAEAQEVRQSIRELRAKK